MARTGACSTSRSTARLHRAVRRSVGAVSSKGCRTAIRLPRSGTANRHEGTVFVSPSRGSSPAQYASPSRGWAVPLRVSGSPGAQPVGGGRGTSGRLRQWLALSPRSPLPPQALLMMAHVDGGPLVSYGTARRRIADGASLLQQRLWRGFFGSTVSQPELRVGRNAPQQIAVRRRRSPSPGLRRSSGGHRRRSRGQSPGARSDPPSSGTLARRVRRRQMAEAGGFPTKTNSPHPEGG